MTGIGHRSKKKTPDFVPFEQQRRIPVCLYTQPVQRLCYSIYGKHAKETRLILGCGMSFVIRLEGDYQIMHSSFRHSNNFQIFSSECYFVNSIFSLFLTFLLLILDKGQILVLFMSKS